MRRAGVELYAEGVLHMVHLSALAALLQEAEAGVHDVASFGVVPAVHQVQLAQGGGVEPVVAVVVVVAEVLLVVRQEDGT